MYYQPILIILNSFQIIFAYVIERLKTCRKYDFYRNIFRSLLPRGFFNEYALKVRIFQLFVRKNSNLLTLIVYFFRENTVQYVLSLYFF